MDLMGKFTISASMLLTGFAIVFGVLLLLIFIIWLYGTVVSNAQNKAAERKTKKELERQKEALKAQKSQQKPAKTAPKMPAAKTDGISEETVAVISAAVYSMYGSKQKVKIKSIKRRRVQSEWARAAVLDYNKPF